MFKSSQARRVPNADRVSHIDISLGDQLLKGRAVFPQTEAPRGTIASSLRLGLPEEEPLPSDLGFWKQGCISP